MKWQDMRKSDNVEDVRRGASRGTVAGGVGLGGIVIALLAALLFGIDPSTVLNTMSGGAAAPQQAAAPVSDQDNAFVRSVLGDTEDVWGAIFTKQLNRTYPAPKLVLFSRTTNSACGTAQTASGPFYCPVDEKVYLDMAFFQAISAAAGPNADFARAYAIAHEVGHHIQNKLGIMGQVQALQQRSDEATGNALSVRLELQADCYAGVWGRFTASRGLVDNADVTTALNTAAQIGDDYLQRRSQGVVSPETWTHGSSAQRVKWYKQGFTTGDINQCDSFSPANP
ncbi:MAG TPA: neutral zinc metallopeptidase [Thermoflexales bacterium]|nr:neutral zinc metallopeptidase [Thermoflexales bacterium]